MRSASGLWLRYSARRLSLLHALEKTAGKADGYVTGLEPAYQLSEPTSLEKERNRVLTLAGRRVPQTPHGHRESDEKAAVDDVVGGNPGITKNLASHRAPRPDKLIFSDVLAAKPGSEEPENVQRRKLSRKPVRPNGSRSFRRSEASGIPRLSKIYEPKEKFTSASRLGQAAGRVLAGEFDGSREIDLSKQNASIIYG